jgi:hypothetical protein
MRDLDDLLDPVVSRQATEATRTPDFAVVARRGRYRRRRARAMAVGAVAAAVAAVSLVGTRVAQDNAAPEPADRIQRFEGPDGELARAIESGDASPGTKVPSRDGSVLLTAWTVNDIEGFDPRDDDSTLSSYGYTLRVDGETYWSKLYDDVSILWPETVGDDAYVVLRTRQADLVDPSGIQPLTFSKTPIDVADPAIDAIVPMLTVRGRYFAIDRETATAAPVRELDGVGPGCGGGTRALVADGNVWALGGSDDLVRYGADGTTSTYRYQTRASTYADTIVQYGDRIGVVWFGAGGDLRVSVPDPTSSEVATYDYPDVGRRCGFYAAVLPDGRLLLIIGRNAVIRSTDETWALAQLSRMPAVLRDAWPSDLLPAGDRVCAGTMGILGAPTEPRDQVCTTDGLHWEPTQLGS